MATIRFTPSLFEFLEQLADNNNRPWFQANKDRYEREVREPCVQFIREFQPHLARISRSFVASDQRVGGSLMRVYRDTRFVRDGAPYKTNVGIQFRHEAGRDVHAPGFYVHIEPNECFLGVGSWRPDPEALRRVRTLIVEKPQRWLKARDAADFRRHFELVGDALQRPPRDFPADHPQVEDLKRTDFIAIEDLSERDVLGKRFLERTAEAFACSRLFMRFLCDAQRLPF